MNTRNLWITGGVAALGLALVALPAPPANSQTACPEESTLARLERKLEQLQAKLAGRNEQAAKLDALVSSQMALAEHRQAIDQLEAFPALAGDDDGAVGLQSHRSVVVTGQRRESFELIDGLAVFGESHLRGNERVE